MLNLEDLKCQDKLTTPMQNAKYLLLPRCRLSPPIWKSRNNSHLSQKTISYCKALQTWICFDSIDVFIGINFLEQSQVLKKSPLFNFILSKVESNSTNISPGNAIFLPPTFSSKTSE